MASKDSLKAERERLREDLRSVNSDISHLHGLLERIEAGIEDRREDRNESDDRERREALHRAIQEKVAIRKVKKERLHAREDRRVLIKKAIRKLGRRIRNLGSPSIVKLDLTFRPMTPQGAFVGVTGHYTAGPLDDDDDEALALWRQYHASHLAQGWSGLGYQIGFTREGTIVLLRPFTSVGSHTLGNNTGRIGVSVHGTTGDTWSSAQLQAYAWWLKNGHTSKFPSSHRTPNPPGQLQRKVHKDFMATSCPGSFESGYRAP